MRYSFRRVFGTGGVEVLVAGTAKEGLELVRLHNPDVIVLDIQLPDRSGLDLFGDVRALAPKRPVVFITAHGTTQTAIEAMKGAPSITSSSLWIWIVSRRCWNAPSRPRA